MKNWLHTWLPAPRTLRLPLVSGRRLGVVGLVGSVVLILLVVMVAPRLVGTYSLRAASKLIEQGLSITQPYQPGSLPTVRNATALSQAGPHLAAAIRWQPDQPHAYRLAGAIHAARGDLERAAQAFDQARKLAPEDTLLAWQASLVYRQMTLADEDYTALAPDQKMHAAWQTAGFDAPRFLLIGQRAYAEQAYPEALAWYELGLQTGERMGELWYHIGLVRVATRAWEPALAALEQASATAFNNRDVQYELGKAQAALRNRESALAAWQRSLNLAGQTGVSSIHYRIGRAWDDISPRAPPRAQAAYAEAIRLDDYGPRRWEKSDTYYRLATYQTEQQQWAAAREAYTQAIAGSPGHARARLGLATVLWQQGERQQAIAEARQAIGLQPNLIAGYFLLGDWYRTEQQIGPARAMYQKVLELDPNNARARQALHDLQP